MPEFAAIGDADVAEHQFRAFRHDDSAEPEFSALVEQCLAAWRLTADAFRETEATGFEGEVLRACLNEHGVELLPATPADDSDITKSPFITDITEILALRMLSEELPQLRLPVPRVLHKEAYGLQHHGVDLLGFTVDSGPQMLAAIEVMASVQDQHPPGTVRDHLKQLLEDTLKEDPPKRLVRDIAYVHDECREGADKDVLNAFIVAIREDALEHPVLAIAVLVRPADALGEDDWRPFRDAVDEFDRARIQGRVVFYAVECSCGFAALMDRVRAAASGKGTES